jgi:HEPN domain-containing protein
MKDETRHWFSYAEENLEMARLALERGYFNTCLQRT